jgi:hypothetical protein
MHPIKSEEIQKNYEAALKKLQKSQKRITVSSAKGKGRELQKWVCEKISNLIGIPYNQQDDDCEIHSREMGQSGVDVVLRGKARKLFPFDVECKSTEGLSLTATIRQAQDNEAPGRRWLIVHRCKVLRDPVVMLSWDSFARLFQGKRFDD